MYIDYKHTAIKQYHKHGKALRTETTINDFGIGKRLTNLPALRKVGFSAHRRLLGVQRLEPQLDPRRTSLHRCPPPHRHARRDSRMTQDLTRSHRLRRP